MTDDNNKNAKLAIRALNSLYEVVMDIYENKDETDPRNDYNLIINSVHEQAIAYKIAHKLENFLQNKNNSPHNNISNDKLSLDVEYSKTFNVNKNKSIVKTCDQNSDSNSCENCILKNDICDGEKYFRPDIILHQRGNNSENILIIECKKAQTIKGKKVIYDFKKLKAFTCENGNFKYKIGVSIVFNNKHPILTYFFKEPQLTELITLLKKQNSEEYEINIYDYKKDKAIFITEYIKNMKKNKNNEE